MDEPDFEQLVSDYYQPLYRFALSLAERESEAYDLTQQTFFLWAAKGEQLRIDGNHRLIGVDGVYQVMRVRHPRKIRHSGVVAGGIFVHRHPRTGVVAECE